MKTQFAGFPLLCGLGVLALTLQGCPAGSAAQCAEDRQCGVGSTCRDGHCAVCSCQAGEGCALGKCYPTSCAGVTCGPGQLCEGNACVDAQCLGVSCPSGEGCARGACYPRQCAGGACGAGEVCLDQRCVEASCVGLSCGAQEACVRGRCIAQSCPGLPCAQGAVCEAGRCVQMACYGISCPAGALCVQGACVPTSCGAQACPPGQVCSAGGCVDRRCEGLTCPVADGGLLCYQGVCATCKATETQCADGFDNDCDGQTDCADADCRGQLCEDGDLCTLGDTCGASGCGGGGRKTCTSPPGACHQAAGICDSTSGGCFYVPKPAGALCDLAASCVNGATCNGVGDCAGNAPVRCNTPPGACRQDMGTCNTTSGQCEYPPLAAGTACDDANACTTGTTCDANGQCLGGSTQACGAPPGQCWETAGSCNRLDAGCVYSPKPKGTACTTGNGCIGGATCDGAGACGGGSVCPNTNPCVSQACVDNKCVATAVNQGGKCGAADASRCCGTECVDISTNRSHCGGCGLQCFTGRACEPVNTTSACNPAPAGVSGRCVCNGATSECPASQVCRAGQAQYNNLCSPNSNASCAAGQSYLEVLECPNYCRY